MSHPDAPGARERPLSDLFSLELGRATATRLRQDPDRILGLARANLARMRQVHSDGSADPWFDAWDALLDGPLDAVVAVLVTDDEPSRQLRQNTPFAGVLPDRERQALIRELRYRLRRELAPEIPDDLDVPGLPKARGIVKLPLRINWSAPELTYDLADRRECALLYELVLAEGSAEDVRWFIDVDVLLDLWDELVLPRAVSTAWIEWIAAHRGVVLQDWRDRAIGPATR